MTKPNPSKFPYKGQEYLIQGHNVYVFVRRKEGFSAYRLLGLIRPSKRAAEVLEAYENAKRSAS